MGVTGLWQLLESIGKSVSIDSLSGKVLAVDVSIWINQAIKGIRDNDGNTVQNAHLILLFNRICKLLYYGIKPVFVFDGNAPSVKKITLAKRKEKCLENLKKKDHLKKKLIENLLTQHAIKITTGQDTQEVISSTRNLNNEQDIFVLKDPPKAIEEPVIDEEEELLCPKELDIASNDFYALPLEMQHEMLINLKEQEKRNSWSTIDQLPKKAEEFSNFQFNRLLKKNNINDRLEEVRNKIQKQANGCLDTKFSADKNYDLSSKRIASEDNAHLFLVKKLKNDKDDYNDDNGLTKISTNISDETDVFSLAKRHMDKKRKKLAQSECFGNKEKPLQIISTYSALEISSSNSSDGDENSSEFDKPSDNFVSTFTKSNVVEKQYNTVESKLENEKKSKRNSVEFENIDEQKKHIIIENKTYESNDFINEEITSNSDDDFVEVTDKNEPIVSNIAKDDMENSMRGQFLKNLPEYELDGITEDKLKELTHNLATEEIELVREAGKFDRFATTINEQIRIEAQQLIKLFGLPYVTAPAEAEAQCAFFDIRCMTDGTITNDSDIWLFGGQTVYKNFFHENKNVELYEYFEISERLSLTREQLIVIAMLSGCDYSIGIENIGPVTSMEIISEFPGKGFELLKNLRNWWLLAQNDNNNKFTKLGNKIKKFKFPSSFPNKGVYDAFENPSVDENEEKFCFSIPDMDMLYDYAKSKLLWTTDKIDQILVPALKNRNFKQLKITTFLETSKRKLKSRRVKNALSRKKNFKKLSESSEDD